MSIILADRSLHEPTGVTNTQIRIWSHTYCIDLVIMDVPVDPFCPIIFGRYFLRTIKAYMDCRREIITLRLGEDEVYFHFSKFDVQPYRKELTDKKGKPIAELAGIYYGVPDEEEEDCADYEETEDEEELDEYDEDTQADDTKKDKTTEEYEVPEKKGDEELPLPELKQLPEELR